MQAAEREWIWHPYIKKNGQPGKSGWMEWAHYPYSVLGQCERCGRLSSADWVKQWFYARVCWPRRRYGDPFGNAVAYAEWKLDPTTREPVLCIGCFNKVRPIWDALQIADENRLLINRIKQEITRARKDRNNGAAPEIPRGDHGRRSGQERRA